MRSFRALLVLCVSLLFLSSAHASLVHIGLLNPDPINASPAKELEAIQAQFSGNEDLIYLQRWNTTSSAGSFDATPGIGSYTIPGGDPTSMNIQWDLSAAAYDLAYVLVKGANDWNLYGVTADQVKDSLGLQEITVNGRNGISHITFFGFASSTVVPEPGTIFVWSMLGLMAYCGSKKSRQIA